ncbi:phosphoribosylformylglycinamidine synthase I [Candidatus Curtissbacteria bacterium]|nr:phosphoribosylformylglycinamidine synthase I [Candidatus Curtissbacteria bacterium]
MSEPRVCILQADGINCDHELFYAFEKYGAQPKFVHVNKLRSGQDTLRNYQILAIPGGFSYGDDIASGKILAIELVSSIRGQIEKFIEKKGLVIGICNGFQALVRTGLLPFGNLGQMDATLSQNKSGHFECRWVKIRTEKSACKFLPAGLVAEVAVNHGEGDFYSTKEVINKVEREKLVTFRYIDQKGKPTMNYPQNPNGSTNAIAGVCDPSGRIIGLMPHPEKFIEKTQNPNWRRPDFEDLQAGFVIKNMVEFLKRS